MLRNYFKDQGLPILSETIIQPISAFWDKALNYKKQVQREIFSINLEKDLNNIKCATKELYKLLNFIICDSYIKLA